MAAAAGLGVQSSDTSNTTSYPSGAFTPPANAVLVVCVQGAGTDPAANGGALTDSQSLGWTKLDERVFGGTGAMYLYRSNARAAASSMTVTFSCPTDAATGAIIQVGWFTGTGLTEAQWNFKIGSSGVAPNVVMSAAINTNNSVIGFLGCLTNPPAVTAPSGWSASSETGFSTPDRGGGFTKKDSGVTVTTVTWGSNAPSTWFGYVIEFAPSGDANATGTLPTVTVSAVAATGSGDAGASGTLATVTVSSAAGAGSGNAGASGTLSTITLSSALGAASGNAGASGTLPTVSVSSATATATGNAAGSGTLATVTLSAPTGVAAGGGNASGTLATVTVAAATGAGSGAAAAAGTLPTVTVSPITGTASAGGNGNASGGLPTVTIVAAAAVASGGASVVAGLPTVTVSTFVGSASGGGGSSTERPLIAHVRITPLLIGRT